MAGISQLQVSQLFNFRNNVVLVTGGASGIGEMVSQAFVENGAYVIIASRKQVELMKVCDRLNKLGPGRADYIVADLKDKVGCDNLVAETKKKTERINVLVNNSGASWGAPYSAFPETGWDKLMALNVKSVFYVTAGMEPLLRKNADADNPSRVINIASMAGLHTADVTTTESGGLSAVGDGTFSYGPSKAACIHLSRIQASKLAPLHINVNCVCPGVFPSRMTSFGLASSMDTLLRAQPTGRIGKPSDIAGLILFLSSYGGAHMVGNVLEIDGGCMRSGWKANSRHFAINESAKI